MKKLSNTEAKFIKSVAYIKKNMCYCSDQSSIYLFEFSNNTNSRIKCKLCSKLTIEVPDVVLVSLLLTLNIFDTSF